MMNQFAFPGLGTIMAGRRIGYPQAAVMVIGFVMAMAFMLWYIALSWKFIKDGQGNLEGWRASFRPHLWLFYDGLGLIAVSWFWSLWSSLQMLRAQKNASSADKA